MPAPSSVRAIPSRRRRDRAAEAGMRRGILLLAVGALLVLDAKGNVVARHDGPEVDQKLLDGDAVEAARRSKDG